MERAVMGAMLRSPVWGLPLLRKVAVMVWSEVTSAKT